VWIFLNIQSFEWTLHTSSRTLKAMRIEKSVERRAKKGLKLM
jgi:hypothetical protein